MGKNWSKARQATCPNWQKQLNLSDIFYGKPTKSSQRLKPRGIVFCNLFEFGFKQRVLLVLFTRDYRKTNKAGFLRSVHKTADRKTSSLQSNRFIWLTRVLLFRFFENAADSRSAWRKKISKLAAFSGMPKRETSKIHSHSNVENCRISIEVSLWDLS